MNKPSVDLAPYSELSSSQDEYYRKGEQLADEGQYEDALLCFDRCLAIQPAHCDAWVFRGVVLIHLERFTDALASCNQAIALQTSNSEAWTFRGVALHRLHRYPEAYASYDRALGVRRQSLWQWLMQHIKRLKQLFRIQRFSS